MKNLTLMLAATAFLLGGVAMLPAQPFPVTAQLKLQEQDASKFAKGVYTDKTRTFRLSSSSLLSLLAPVYPETFPNGFPFGSRLILKDYAYFQVQGPTGAILVNDTAPYLTYSDTFSITNFLYQGKENTLNNSLNHTYFYQSTIRLENPSPNGTSFTFTGNTLEKYVRSAERPNGDYFSQGSLTITGIGTGNTGGSFFLLSGKFRTPTVKWIE